jgi:glycosyltransferase involved in cell wall biosynthesis/ubiquinone/menaquinone biosynthesis C-methylase UbiE
VNAEVAARPALDPLKDRVRAHYDQLAPQRDRWYRRNSFYHSEVERRLAALIPAGSSVLELGCGTGNLLSALKPARGLGIDISGRMVEIARSNHPELTFEMADAECFTADEQFDFVVASDLIGELGDINAMFECFSQMSHGSSKLVITFHSPTLEEIMRIAQRAGFAMAPFRQNWVGVETARGLLALSDLRVVDEAHALLVPTPIPLLAPAANRLLAGRRALKYFDLLNILVAEPDPNRSQPRPLSCSVIIPCRNEIGNIDAAVERMPDLGPGTEIIFVDGASTDGTKERIEEVIDRYRGSKDIKLILQMPEASYGDRKDDPDAPTVMLKLGKGDAVRKGFDAASGDVLMILDADLTVPPEDLPRFLRPIATGKGRFINGTRLVYPMEERAMKFVNYVGNWFFSKLFTWLLEQPIRDTLCGTKVLLKSDYAEIKAGRKHFGDFDPFGDFDLLFGAARLGIPIVEVPVRYRRRLAGVSKVRVSRHGWLLVAMSLVAFRRLKLARWKAKLRGTRRP